MRITHKFDKSFGPAASFSGILIFIAGLIASFFAVSGLFLIIFGAFIAFTNTSTTIDAKNKKLRFSNNLFGIIKTGKWLKVDMDMQIGAKRASAVYRTYSMSNRSITSKVDHTILYLFDKEGNQLMPIMQLQRDEDSTEKIDELCSALAISKLA